MTHSAVRIKDMPGLRPGATRVLWLVGEGDVAHHVVTTYAEARTGPETFVFPANPDGSIASHDDLPGSRREADAHQDAITDYVASLNGETVPAPEFTIAELFDRAFGGAL